MAQRVWKISPGEGEDKKSLWPQWNAKNYISMGWNVRNLRKVKFDTKFLNKLKKIFPPRRKKNKQIRRNYGYIRNQLKTFYEEVQQGDIVIAYGQNYNILGIGVVGGGRYKGDYFYDDTKDFVNCRNVTWKVIPPDLNVRNDKVLSSFFKQRNTLKEILKNGEDENVFAHLVKLEPRLQNLQSDPFTNENIKKEIEKNRRIYGLRPVDSDESENNAAKRERKQIIYEQNWDAQERANKNHRKTLQILSKEIKKYGIEPQASVIDLFAKKGETIFIFEVKSSHTDNFIHQTRMAIGQLLDYGYFQVRCKSENAGKTIFLGIAYNKKPPPEIVDFLRHNDFYVFWTDDKEFEGEKESKKQLYKFLEG